jgi:hypothetical protein
MRPKIRAQNVCPILPRYRVKIIFMNPSHIVFIDAEEF